MPYYTSVASIINRYGADAVLLGSDHDNDGAEDSDTLSSSIIDAEGEINSYLGKVYTLPLPGVTDLEAPENNANVPSVLRRIATDIAVYRFAADYGGSLTVEKRQRYDDALAWLNLLVSGKVSLGLAVEAPSFLANPVSYDGPERIFTRSKMRGF